MIHDIVDVAVRMGLCKYHKACALILAVVFNPCENGGLREQAYYAEKLDISGDEVVKLVDNLKKAGLFDVSDSDIDLKEYSDTINLEALKD